MKYEILNNLKTAKTICLIGHSTPDSDALCSMVVFKNFLTKTLNIKRVDIFAETNEIPEIYQHVLATNKLNVGIKTYDCAIAMDSANPDVLGCYYELFKSAKNSFIIDHHNTNLKYAKYNIVEYCSSTCEVVYRILKAFKHNFTTFDYERIYAGIITDTNNLTVGNISNKTFAIAGECYKHADCQNIYTYFFSNNTMKHQQMFAKAILNSVTFNHGRILISQISKDEDEMFKAEKEDYTGIINRLAQTKGVDLVCFVYPKNNSYYVSMRARKGFDVSEIAKRNGGGGHIGAAAFSTNKQIAEIEQCILNEFMEELSNKKIIFNKNPFKS